MISDMGNFKDVLNKELYTVLESDKLFKDWCILKDTENNTYELVFEEYIFHNTLEDGIKFFNEMYKEFVNLIRKSNLINQKCDYIEKDVIVDIKKQSIGWHIKVSQDTYYGIEEVFGAFSNVIYKLNNTEIKNFN